MRKEIGIGDAHKWRVIDLNTNTEIEGCIMADDITGKYIQYRMDEDGKFITKNGYLIKDKKRGNIKLIHSKEWKKPK